MYSLSVSIVLHNTNPKLIESVLTTLKNEKVQHIYLIDNSPSDNLKRYSQTDSRIIYRHIPNKGFGNAHNIAIRESILQKNDYHLILNPDVRWNGEILQTLISEMNMHENCALIQPRICYSDGTLQHTCRLLPTPFDVFARRFVPSFMVKSRIDRYLLAEECYNKEFNAVYMQGSFMLFRTDALAEIGMFDERFFMYPEDIDITRRIRKNYMALYFPGISIIHDHAAASQKIGRMMWIHICNMVKYFNKWGWFFDKERRCLNRRLLSELKM